MARARNIKPAFFQNEELVELPFSTRLLFIGLWTLADRDGRLEDRPKRIKMALFPADDLNVDAALCELDKAGFITRYEHDENKYIQVDSFSKHQNPHRDEKASLIPEPNLHSANTVQAPCKEVESTVSIGLIPDSLNLIPVSPKEECGSSDAEAPEAKVKQKAFDFAGALQAGGVDQKVVTGFLANRKTKRLANTEIAYDGLVREASKAGLSLADALQIAAEKGWGAFDSSWNWARASPHPVSDKHSGFDNRDYTAGINADGSF